MREEQANPAGGRTPGSTGKPPRKKNDIMLKGAAEEYFPWVLRLFYENADQLFDMDKGFEWMNN